MPLIWISLSFFGGILTADQLPESEVFWLWSLVIGLVFLLAQLLVSIWREFNARALGVACVVSFSLGALRYSHSLPDLENPAFISHHAGQDERVVVTGVVTDFPDVHDEYTSFLVDVEKIRESKDIIHQKGKGTILGRVPVGEEVKYGDRVVLRGYLKIPPEGEGFSYRTYLARKGVYAYMPKATVGVLDSGHGNPLLRAIYRLKCKGLKTVYRIWPDPEASLLAGILLGEESGIPDSVERAFQDTSTSHIIAISGFNITIVAGLMAGVCGRFLRPPWGLFSTVVGIGVYTVLVGADAAVMRAAWMGGLALFARQIGRRHHGLHAVAVASLVMGALNPHILWDVSFQLSLAATLGLILYAEDMADWFLDLSSRVITADRAQHLTKPVSEYVLFTFAAQITTFPVLLYHFQRISWIGFLANPAILPAQPPIMILGGLALLMGLIWFPLGKAAGLLVYPFMTYTIRAVEWFAGLQGQIIHTGDISLLGVILMYVFLAVVTFGRKWFSDINRVLKPSLVVMAFAVGNALVWRSLFYAPDDLLHLSILEVGTGSAILLRSPAGERVLINGGPSASALADGLGRRLSVMDQGLDLLVVASPLEEDIAALVHFVGRNPPQNVLWLGAYSPSRAADYLRAVLGEREVPVLAGEPGAIIQVGEDIQLEVLAETNRGGILLLTYDRFRALFPFGISGDCIHDLREGMDIGQVSLLWLADQGYIASNPGSWIGNLNPRLLVLSVAPDDPNGLPSPALLAEMAGYSLLRTDRHGWVEITTDGQRMWIDVARLP
ncbi:MAG: ComEC/Rec2 family competence protein [Anaerolineales bacterium]